MTDVDLSYRQISLFLKKAGTVFLQRQLLRGGNHLVLLVLLLLFPIYLTGLFNYWNIAFRGGLWLVIFVVMLFLFYRQALKPWLFSRQAMNMACLVEEKTFGLYNYLTTSVELYPRLADLRQRPYISADLTEEVIGECAKKVSSLDVDTIFRSKSSQGTPKLFILLLVVHLLIVAFWPGFVGNTLSIFLVGRHNSSLESRSGITLGSGDFQITYHYPTYSRLDTRLVQGGSGHIEALKGTEVKLQVRVDKAVTQASLVYKDQNIPLQISQGKILNGKLMLISAGKYYISAQGEGGQVLNSAKKGVKVVPDRYPKVTLISPKGNLEKTVEDNLEIWFDLQDDFGLKKIDLVMKELAQEEEKSFTIKEFVDNPKNYHGSYSINLAADPFKPGQKWAYYLVVYDNDMVSGSKKSTSPSRYLNIFSFRKQLHQYLDRIEQLWEELIARLDEELNQQEVLQKSIETWDLGEHKLGVKKNISTTRLTNWLNKLKILFQEMGQNPYSSQQLLAALENIYDNLLRKKHFKHRKLTYVKTLPEKRSPVGLTGLRHLHYAVQELVKEVENDIIYMEDIFQKSKLDELIRRGKELLEAQKELAELLQKYREQANEEMKKQLQSRIARLQEEIKKLMEEVAALQKGGFDNEHLNREALREMEMLSKLPDIQRQLEMGKLEEAALKLQEMSASLSNFLSAAQNAQIQFGAVKYQQLMDQLNKFSRDFDYLEREEKKIKDETQKAVSRYRKQLHKKMANRIKSLTAVIKKKIAQMHKLLNQVNQLSRQQAEKKEMVHRRLADIGLMIKHHDFMQALQMAKEAQQKLLPIKHWVARELKWKKDPQKKKEWKKQDSRLARGVALMKEIVADLQKFFPDTREILTPKELQSLKRLAREQKSMAQKCDKLKNQMGKLGGQMPLFNQEMSQMMDQTGAEMKSAHKNLENADPAQALEREKAALEKLAGLRKEMQNARQLMAGGSGMPMPFSKMNRRQRRGMGRGWLDRQKVEIPGSDKYRVPKEFREDILKALKDRFPKGYEREIKDYYEKLVR